MDAAIHRTRERRDKKLYQNVIEVKCNKINVNSALKWWAPFEFSFYCHRFSIWCFELDSLEYASIFLVRYFLDEGQCQLGMDESKDSQKYRPKMSELNVGQIRMRYLVTKRQIHTYCLSGIARLLHAIGIPLFLVMLVLLANGGPNCWSFDLRIYFSMNLSYPSASPFSFFIDNDISKR